MIALIPLAASLLYLAQRFRWYRLTIGGLVVTYGSYVLVTGIGPAAAAQVIRGQTFVAIYWLLFESYDLLDTARRRRGRSVEIGDRALVLFPLNTCAFIGVSLLQWFRYPQLRLDILLACIAGAFALDAAVRAVIRPPKSFTREQGAAERVIEGGYEGAVTVAAVLAAIAIYRRFSGLEIEVALLLEAEMLTVTGLALGEEYLEGLGNVVFVLPAAKLILLDRDLVARARVSLLGFQFRQWSLVTVLAAAVAYFNRWSIGQRYAPGCGYFASFAGAIASLLVVMLIRFEAGSAFVIVGWSLMMLVVLYLGTARGDRDLLWQSYAIAVLVFVRGWTTNFYVPGTVGGGITLRVTTAATAIVALYVAEFMSSRKVGGDGQPTLTSAARLVDAVERNARLMFALLATALLTLLLYHEVSGQVLTEAWALEGAALLALGFAERERVLRYCALVLLGACVLKVFFYDLRNLETLPRILSFIVLGLLMLAVSFIYTRFYERLRRYL